MQSYGLKVNTKYNLSDYASKIMTTAGDVILFESGVYKIYCDGDIFIKHNIVKGLMHITCISVRDDIKINIEAKGEINEELSDIYHQVIIQNKNVEVNINAKGIVDNLAKIIYRSNIKNYDGKDKLNLNSSKKEIEIGSGSGKQKAEFLKMSDMSEIDAEPSLDIIGDSFKSSHSFSTMCISEEKKNYLSLHGYEYTDIEKEIKDSFLNI